MDNPGVSVYLDGIQRIAGPGGRDVWLWPDGTMLPVVAGGSDIGPAINPDGTTITLPPPGNQTIPPAPPAPPAPSQQQQLPRTFTAEEVERFRAQERQKLHDDIAARDAELERLRQAEAARLEAEKARADAEAEATRRAAEEEMSAKELIEARDREWQQRFDALQAERAQEQAIAAREREFQELESYKAQVLAANSDNILPRLRQIDLVSGSTREEINRAVEKLVQASADTMADLQAVDDQGRRLAPGVSTFAPVTNPDDLSPSTRTLTPEQIQSMPMAEWAKIRTQLGLDNRGPGDRGMFF